MRRRQSVLYQALATPPVVIPPPSFGWFRPLTEPTRFKGGYPDARNSTALAASGEIPFPAIQPSIDARNTRWYQQWVDPPRILKDPDNAAQAASGLTFAAAIQPTFDNRNVNWHRPLSEPQRFAGGWVDQGYLQAIISGEIAPPAISPTNDNKNARWFVPLSEPRREYRYVARITGEFPWSQYEPNKPGQPVDQLSSWYRQLAEPVRYPRDPRYGAVLLGGETLWAYNQPAADNATTRWFQPLSEPRREYRFVARIAGESPWSMVAADPSGVFPDGWFAEWRLPVRFPRDRRFTAAFAAGEVQWPYSQPATDNANLRWHAPFSLPVRYPRDPRYTATLDASGEPKWAYAQPASDNATARWWRPFSEPQRFKRDPTATIALFVSGEAPRAIAQFLADNANVRWHSPLSEPQRFKRDPRFSATLAASGYVVRADTVFIDANVRWFAPFSLPVRFAREPRYETALYASGEIYLSTIPISEPLGTTRKPLLAGGMYWKGRST